MSSDLLKKLKAIKKSAGITKKLASRLVDELEEAQMGPQEILEEVAEKVIPAMMEEIQVNAEKEETTVGL